MKITKQRLKEIIKEELSDTVLLSEGVWEEWFKIKEQYPNLWQSVASDIAFAIEKVPGQKSIKRAKYGKYSPKWAQAKVGQVPTPQSAEWAQLPMAVKRAATGALKKWLKEKAPARIKSSAHSKALGRDPGWKEEEDFFSRGGTRDPEQRQAVRELNTKLTKQRLKEMIKEEFRTVMTEELGSGIRWSKHNQAPSRGYGYRDVYNAEDEQLIQQALGPDYYVIEYQYDASGESGMEAQDRSRAYFDKYVMKREPAPNGGIVVMPQKTLEQDGSRVHYFKMAHDRDEDGNMYAMLVT